MAGKPASAIVVAIVFLVATLAFAPKPASAFQQDDPEAAISLYNTAAGLFKDKQYDLAIGQWNKLLEDYPGCSLQRDARYYIGVAHYNQQHFEDAVQQFSSLRDSLPNLKDYRRSELLLFYLGFSQWQVGKAKGEDGVEDIQSALTTYEQFFEDFPNSEQAAECWFYNGEILYDLDRISDSANTLQQASASYKKVLDEFPDAAKRKEAMYAYGVCMEETGEYAPAIQIYTEYISDYSDDSFTDEIRLRKADTLLQLGIGQKNAGDPDAAAETFLEAEKIYQPLTEKADFPKLANAIYQRAYCLLNLNQPRKAAEQYAIIANDHKDFEFAGSAALDAGKYYLLANELEGAGKWLQKVVDTDETNRAEATHWLCQIKLDTGEFDEALSLANAALENNPGGFEANLLMDAADAMYSLPDRRNESVAVYEKLANEFSSHPVAPKALYFAAFGYVTNEQNAEAIRCAKQFQERYADDSRLPDTLEVMGRAALAEKQLPLAESTFRDLVGRFADHPRADWWQTRVGWVSYMKGEHDDAIGWLSQAVREMSDPVSKSEAHYVMGCSQYELKNYVKAIEELDASLKENAERSNADEARLLAARAHARLGETDQAIQLAETVWNDSRDAAAAYWLGEFNYQQGEFETASTYYQRVVDSEVDSELLPDALYGLAWSQSSNLQTSDALKTFDELISRFQDHPRATDALIGRGKACRVAGRFKEAIIDLDVFLSSDQTPRNKFNAAYERALCHAGLENWTRAAEELGNLTQDFDEAPELADDILFELGWAQKKLENQDASLASFRRIANEYPESEFASESNYHLGQAFYDKAVAEAEAVKSGDSGPETAIGLFDDAIASYQLCLDNSPGDDVGPRAAYKLAWCHFKKKDYAAALKAFEYQTTTWSDGELYALGLSMVAESHFNMEQHSEAVTVYKKAIPAIESTNNTNSIRILAPIHAAQSANKIKNYQAAIEYAQLVVDNHGDSPYLADAWYEIGVARKGLGDIEPAVEAWTAAMEKSLGKTGARARCMIAEQLFEEKKYKEAIDQFKLVFYGYGGSESAEDIKPWQAFAIYEAARCNYVQVSNTDDSDRRNDLIKNARDLFQMLIDKYPDDRLAADARKQIQVLDSLN